MMGSIFLEFELRECFGLFKNYICWTMDESWETLEIWSSCIWISESLIEKGLALDWSIDENRLLVLARVLYLLRKFFNWGPDVNLSIGFLIDESWARMEGTVGF
jgi:hypothetical protein